MSDKVSLSEVSHRYIRSYPTRSKLSRQDWWVDCIARVGHLSHKALDRISSVLSGLDTAIRQGNHILAKHTPLRILGLTLLEAGVSLRILHPVLVTIGLRGQVFNGVGGALGSGRTGRGKR